MQRLRRGRAALSPLWHYAQPLRRGTAGARPDDRRNCGVGGSIPENRDNEQAPNDNATHDHVSAWEEAGRNWRAGVDGMTFHTPPRASTFKRWIGKRIAIHHLRNVAPSAREEGRFDDVEEDVADGARECLRHLARNLTCLAPESPKALKSSLVPPLVENMLSERLQHMTDTFHEANAVCHWDLQDIASASVDRLFFIAAASRGGVLQRSTHILGSLGQQFVLTDEQAQRLFKRDVRSRMSVLQDVLFSDIVVVADVVLQATQRSSLRRLDACSGSSEQLVAPQSADDDDKHDVSKLFPDLGEPRSVEHVLRLEMCLTASRSYEDDDYPEFTASAWQIADWNWMCYGNHPALPADIPAPW